MSARPFVLGLTGSIGMGKSTTAAMFADEGVPIWSADAAVDRIYSSGGGGAVALAGICPCAIRPEDDSVDRSALRDSVERDSSLLNGIEACVHPLVREDRKMFTEAAAKSGERLVAVEIPLLYETGGETEVDAVAVVSVPSEMQRERVMARPGMTEGRFRALVERQMPDSEKRARADYLVDARTPALARRGVEEILRDILRKES